MNTLHVTVYAASPYREQPIVGLRVDATEAVPDLTADTDWETRWQQFYEKEGQTLANALIQTLPGGTIDQLLRRLLEYRASLLRVTL